jgi:hypothetical protein
MHQNDLLRNTRRRLARDASPQSQSSMESDPVPPAVQLARARKIQRQQIQTG